MLLVREHRANRACATLQSPPCGATCAGVCTLSCLALGHISLLASSYLPPGADMLRERLRMLHAVHVQALMIGGMQPGDRLCLPVTDLQLLLHRQNLEEKLRRLQQLPPAEAEAARAEARRHLWTSFPEHHTHFAFEEGPGSLFVVGRDGAERAGLPRWTGEPCQLPRCPIHSMGRGLTEHSRPGTGGCRASQVSSASC